MDKIYRMWGVTLWEKVFINDERNNLSELCKISNAVWERDMVSEKESDSNFEKN